jgi:hypothetical protein
MILSYLIQTHCTEAYLAQLIRKKSAVEIQQFHRECSEDCVVKYLAGETDWQPIFSFGRFPEKVQLGLLHRIGKDRERGAVAEGRIVSIEAVPEGTEFEFTVALSASLVPHSKQLEAAIREVGQLMGVGHYKPLGLGRFEVISIERLDLAGEIQRTQRELSGMPASIRLGLDTPLIIENGGRPLSTQGRALAEELARWLAQRTAEVRDRFGLTQLAATEPVAPEHCTLTFRPDYISRQSFEEGQRKNALVALPGSYLKVQFSQPSPALEQQLAVSHLFGVGPWADVGFGRLKLETRPE